MTLLQKGKHAKHSRKTRLRPASNCKRLCFACFSILNKNYEYLSVNIMSTFFKITLVQRSDAGLTEQK